MDKSQQHIEHLQGVVETVEATEDTCETETIIIRERVQNFIERAPKYDGNSEIMFEWWENLETPSSA